MDWSGWALFGLVATVTLTTIMVAAQLAGMTRMGIPLMLGTMLFEDPDRARVAGFLMHLVAGQIFALFYAWAFAQLELATWWLGGLFGAFHGLVALAVIVPLIPGVHPRMASERAGDLGNALEPPGLLALNYGTQTPVVAMAAHIVFGVILGSFLTPA